MKNWKTAGNMAVFFFSFRPFSFYISLHFTDLLYIVLRPFLREADSIFYIHRLELSKEGVVGINVPAVKMMVFQRAA